ncbi:MAG TPA: enoyl-CoA hydratase/isomerase family protein [Acidimicrobiales bacterium]|nr:enoyl-CoA hydratase/isomerase family protein [Acidimicrobiales bacterium]
MTVDGRDNAAAAVRYEHVGDVAVVTLNRPDRLNAVNDVLVDELCGALRRAREELPGAVVLTGEGRAFCAGHDLKQTPREDADAALVVRLERLADVTRGIRQLPMAVIAAVRGYALGAGCEFAICCDLVVAEPGAVFGFPEVEVGLAVTGGVTHLLPVLVGPAKAHELVLLGTRITAQEAATLGLVNALADDPLARAMEWARALAAKPRLALAMAKSCLGAGFAGSLEEAFSRETAVSIALLHTPEALAAAEAFRARRGHGARHT